MGILSHPKGTSQANALPRPTEKKERPIDADSRKNPVPSEATHHRVYENAAWEPDRILALMGRDPVSLVSLIDRRETLGWSFVPWRIDRVTEGDGRDKDGSLADILESIRLPDPARIQPLDPGTPPFTGGYVVLIPFEWGELLEPSGGPFSRPEVPLVLAECSEVVAYHHKSRTLWVPPSCPIEPSRERAQWGGPVPPSEPRAPVRLTPSLSFGEYRERFERVMDAIRAGQFFQLNFALFFEGAPEIPLDLPALYRSLARTNPGPGMGYFAWKERAFLSNSPERLLTVADGWLTTSPIAGTLPSDAPLPGDATAFANDPKERAEHVMTVDILRNDLGRVSLPGSVEVSRFLAIERYAHLLHLVSDVRGKAVPGLSFRDLLNAVFPGGSVTGAPKREVRKTIGEIEGRPRDYYCGSFGFLSDSGVWDLNLLIRTLFVSPGRLRLPVGSGIVADSDPRREYDEIFAKARAFLEHLDVPARTGGGRA